MYAKGCITTSMKKLTSAPKNDGFTLIELLIAIGLFAILVPVLMGFLTLLAVINDRARDVAIVNALVENKIESLRSKGFVALTNGETDFTNELSTDIAGARSATYAISTAEPGLKQIDVIVTYDDHGDEKTLNYRTYLGELGVGQY